MGIIDTGKRNIIFNVAVIFTITVLLVSLFLIFHTDDHALNDFGGEAIDIEHMWQDETGEMADLSDLTVPETYSLVVDGDTIGGRDLCFRSKNVSFRIMLDDQLIYEYHPVIPKLFGRSYGVYFHSVSVPDFEGERVIRIIASPSYENSKGYFKEIKLQEGSSYISDLYAKNTPYFALSLFMFVMGAVLIAGGYAVLNTGDYGREIISMGVFAVLSATWSSTETAYLQLISGNPAAVHFLSYMMLILMPGTALLFVGYLTGNANRLCVRIMSILSLCQCVFDIIITLIGVSDYHGLLFLTHIQLAAAIFLSAYYIIHAVRTSMIKRNQMVVISLAFLAVLAGGGIDLVRYYFHRASSDTAMFFRLGLLLFILIMSVHEVRKLSLFRKYENEADEMRDLAHTDALTGLQNRMSYSEYENDLRRDSSGSAIIIQFDVNYLKKVNDSYGHAAGDKHIRAAASAIEESFSRFGKCYRTGGDEFIVVIKGSGVHDKFESGIIALERAVKDYNISEKPPINLEIAYGMSEFDLGHKDPEEALKQADSLMYAMKAGMKQAAGT